MYGISFTYFSENDAAPRVNMALQKLLSQTQSMPTTSAESHSIPKLFSDESPYAARLLRQSISLNKV